MTKIYGILASPAGHSLSPAMFNAAFAETGIDARYEVFDEPDLGKLSDWRNLSPNLAGLSVSSPYKESILEYLDEMSEDVRAIGACNTVKIDDIPDDDDGNSKKIARGFNTDWIGFLEALKEKIATVKDLNVVVLGAGGAARAIVYGLVKEGAKVVILNRTIEKAAKIAEDFSHINNNFPHNNESSIQYGELGEIDSFKCDLLVQATSVLISDNGPDSNNELGINFITEEFLQNNTPVVFDIIYKPLITPLLQMALDNGCEVITGEKMLLNQAVKQFEIWFGEKAPVETMRKAIEPIFKN